MWNHTFSHLWLLGRIGLSQHNHVAILPAQPRLHMEFINGSEQSKNVKLLVHYCDCSYKKTTTTTETNKEMIHFAMLPAV